jgi:hypothetical protein
MKAIRLILGLVVGGIGVAAGRRKDELASFRPAVLPLEKTPCWRRGRKQGALVWRQILSGA